MQSTLAGLLAFAASVAAVAPTPHLEALAARDSDDLYRCQSAASAFFTQYPTVPGAFVTYAETATNVLSGCHPTMPASLEQAYSSYASEVTAWFSSHKSAYSSLVSDCPSFNITSSLTAITCSPTFVGTGAAAVSATATATTSGGTATVTATGTAATAKSGSGDKNPGMVGMAAMVAAAGAVAVLA